MQTRGVWGPNGDRFSCPVPMALTCLINPVLVASCGTTPRPNRAVRRYPFPAPKVAPTNNEPRDSPPSGVQDPTHYIISILFPHSHTLLSSVRSHQVRITWFHRLRFPDDRKSQGFLSSATTHHSSGPTLTDPRNPPHWTNGPLDPMTLDSFPHHPLDP